VGRETCETIHGEAADGAGMRLRFTFPGGEFTGQLYANPVADDLAAQLPLDVSFSDYNGVEKVADLPRPLRVEGVPPTAEPAPGEISYYAPATGIVLYYGHVGRWPGIVRIGRFDFGLDALRDLSDGTVVRIDRQDP
jgi:hypothetical protein